jgi:acyl-CoA dehydrogenase
MAPAASFLEDIRRIAGAAAGPFAGDVDREARFPTEAFAQLREANALSAAIPHSLGGGGLELEPIARGCLELSRSCAASGMIFAMHQIQVLCIARHLDGASWYEDYLRDVAAKQRLIASATSEQGTGGDMSRSVAALEPGADGLLGFEKQATTISYGAQADDLLTTLRRAPDSEPSDQVLVLSRGEQTTLEQRGEWDTLGMRGTCSPGFRVRASFPAAQVLPTPFAQVMAESMVPISHILWSHVWLGIAADAFERARAHLRTSARGAPDAPLPAAHRLSSVMAELALLRAEVARALSDFERIDAAGRDGFATLATALRFNNLKLAASEQAVRVCRGVLEVVGVAGYRNDTPCSVGRHLRDVLSAPIMVANERIVATDARLLLIAKEAE